MPNYKITTELTTYVWLPEEFDPSEGSDILEALDLFVDEADTWQTGFRMFEDSIKVNGEHSKPRYEVIS